MLDLVERAKPGTDCEVTYVWFDTGLEYRATRDHLDYLEQRYGIEILRYRAIKSIPTCCREYGEPFLSKYVSQNVSRLQGHGFQWEDEPFEELVERYPRCTSALKWWTNAWTRTGRPGFFDIGRNSMLKEFMTLCPPDFPISDKCCTYTKKDLAKRVNRELGADVDLVGVREAEGGVRKATAAYRKGCFTAKEDGTDHYRPLYWWSDSDKAQWNEMFGVVNSDCYTMWGFKRTGCVGCPFNRNVIGELEIARQHEPQMVRAVERVFARSYEYTAQYHEFRRSHGGQMRLDLRHAR